MVRRNFDLNQLKGDRQAFIREIEALNLNPRGNKCLCPFPEHDDHNPSASIHCDDNHNRIYCHVCKRGADIFDLMKLSGRTVELAARTVPKQRKPIPDKPVKVWDELPISWNGKPMKKWFEYTNEDSRVLFVVGRTQKINGAKECPVFTKWNGGWRSGLHTDDLLYNLDRLGAAESGDTCYIAEGEPCCSVLTDAGLLAVSNRGGAIKKPESWPIQFNRLFRGLNVIVLADYDEPGVVHAKAVAQALSGVAASIKIVSVDWISGVINGAV